MQIYSNTPTLQTWATSKMQNPTRDVRQSEREFSFLYLFIFFLFFFGKFKRKPQREMLTNVAETFRSTIDFLAYKLYHCNLRVIKHIEVRDMIVKKIKLCTKLITLIPQHQVTLKWTVSLPSNYTNGLDVHITYQSNKI